MRRDEARNHDVKVTDLEDDSDLQDLVLSIHHAAVHTFAGTPAAKLIENDLGKAYVQLHGAGPVIIQGPLPQPPIVVPAPPPGP